MSKFTKGPWEVCAVDGGWDGVKPVNQKMPVCSLVENNPANAALIAAAPAMYKAIEAALLDLECCYDVNGDSMGDSDAAEKLRAALRAADGGE